jgi:hypothetical protein
MPPRPTFIALAVLLTFVLILLLHPFAQTLSYVQAPAGFCGVAECGQSLRSWIQEEEARYGEALEGREQLVKAWGPTEDAVQS